MKLIEIAERFKALQEQVASSQPGDDAEVVALKAEAQKAVDAGDLAKADALLAQIETQQRQALDRFAVNAAETSSKRGDIALTRLQYGEAAKRFAASAAMFPPGGANEEKRIAYLEKEADALYRQGSEFGDNGALAAAIDRWKQLLALRPRAQSPLDWAKTESNLGNALWALGERESSTARLEEAVAADRAGLEERTRERVPLDWAMTQNKLGNALSALGERESGTARLEQAVAAYRAALEEYTRERVPLDWAATEMNFGSALWALGERESGTGRLEEAVAAYRAALEEYTRERVPLDWATTQNSRQCAPRAWRAGERDGAARGGGRGLSRGAGGEDARAGSARLGDDASRRSGRSSSCSDPAPAGRPHRDGRVAGRSANGGSHRRRLPKADTSFIELSRRGPWRHRRTRG